MKVLLVFLAAGLLLVFGLREALGDFYEQVQSRKNQKEQLEGLLAVSLGSHRSLPAVFRDEAELGRFFKGHLAGLEIRVTRESFASKKAEGGKKRARFELEGRPMDGLRLAAALERSEKAVRLISYNVTSGASTRIEMDLEYLTP
ncbi:MAG: hypothetical protein J0L75_08280 [Spirochaetes bacterium]|nr:hypothetical protein [Spirochaetota bacterium]